MRWDVVGDQVEIPANVLCRELRNGLATTSGYNNLTVYVNYAYGDETPVQIYGADKFHRLLALEKEYGLENNFRFYNSFSTS